MRVGAEAAVSANGICFLIKVLTTSQVVCSAVCDIYGSVSYLPLQRLQKACLRVSIAMKRTITTLIKKIIKWG